MGQILVFQRFVAEGRLDLMNGTFTHAEQTDMYAAWKHGYDNMFTYRDEKEHAKHRRAVGNAYAMSSVLDSEVYIDQCSDLFLQRLGEMAQAGQTVDLGHWLQMYAFDVVTELFYGKAFGLMEARQDFGWFELLEGVVQAVAIVIYRSVQESPDAMLTLLCRWV